MTTTPDPDVSRPPQHVRRADMDPNKVVDAAKQAHKNRTSVRQYLGGGEPCDCDNCYQRIPVPRLPGTIKMHWQRYGHACANFGAGPCGSQHRPPPASVDPDLRDNYNPNNRAAMELDDVIDDLYDDLDNRSSIDIDNDDENLDNNLDQDLDDNFDANLAKNLDDKLGDNMYGDNHSCAGSNSRSSSRSGSGSGSGAEPDDKPEFGRIDGAEYAAFYADLFSDDEDMADPPAFDFAGPEAREGAEERGEEEEDGDEDKGGEDDSNGEPNSH
ncbi:hypothetical protein FRC09_001907 [Ceratobasidium sp. 395]|nr:hypothetical protein FRC09_001907 [Ceratobasidium sp. 395]